MFERAPACPPGCRVEGAESAQPRRPSRARAMLGLDAYGSSSEEDEPTKDDAPAPAPAPAPERPAPARRPASAGLNFSNLPKPGGSRRVVTIPAPALARAVEADESDSDSDGYRAKRARGGEDGGVSGAGRVSLASALPKPKRAALGGSGGVLGGGGGGGAMLDVGGGFDALDRGAVDEEVEEEEEAGPSVHASSLYAVDDAGEYVNPETRAYAASGYVEDDGREQPVFDSKSSDFVDQALAAAAKIERERHGREIKILTINADDVRKVPTGPGAAIIAPEGQLQHLQTTQASSTARYKHQLTSLVHEAKVEEARALESGDKLASTRAQARRKYGW